MGELPTVPKPQPSKEQLQRIGAAMGDAAGINVRLCAESLGISLDAGAAMQAMLYAATRVVVQRPGPTTDPIEQARREAQAGNLFNHWMRGFSDWCGEHGFDYQKGLAAEEPNESN